MVVLMVEMNEAALRALSAKAGLPLQFTFKEVKLFEVLAKILQKNREEQLDIVMKGGTALNKIYLPGVQRFSEDIDFDLFSDKKNLGRITAIEGFETEGPWRMHNTLRYHLSYSFMGKKDNIRVEFVLNKGKETIMPVQSGSMISDITGTALYGVPVYGFEDLLARKMNALRERTEGKDIWDSWQAIPKAKKLKNAITLALASDHLNMSAQDSLEQTVAAVKNVDAKQVMKLTNPYIPTFLRPKNWEEVKNQLLARLQQLFEK